MDVAWKIFRKSVLSVFYNLDDAIRLTGGIFIITVFLSTALNVFLTGSLMPPDMSKYQMNTADPEPMIVDPSEIGAIFGGMVIFLIAFSWIAVAWHRFILNKEINQELLPELNVQRIVLYAWKTILISVCLVLMLMLPLLILTVVFSAVGLGGSVSLLSLVAFYYLLLRFGMILPATAVDKELKFSESFIATKPLATQIIGVAFIQVIFVLVLAVVTAAIAPNNLVGVLIGAVTQWVGVLVSASLLTTLYSHLVQMQKLT